MKKTLLFLFSIVFTLSSFAQNQIEVIDEEGNEIPNEGVYSLIINSSANPTQSIEPKFHVFNRTNTDLNLYIRREKGSNVPAQWTDAVCWPPSCFETNNSPSYKTPTCSGFNLMKVSANSGVTDQIDFNTGGFMPAHIKPNIRPENENDRSNANYIYRVVDCATDQVYHSFTLDLTYALENVIVKKDTQLTFGPNPASEYVTINSTDGNGTIQMIDVLGNIVYSSDFNGNKKINTSTFKNGVYFVRIITGTERINKKLVIKH